MPVISSCCINQTVFYLSFYYYIFQTNTTYMKCAINSVRYDATLFSNTAVCQNVIVSYCYNIFILLVFRVINPGSLVEVLVQITLQYFLTNDVQCIVRQVQKLSSYIITCMLIPGDKPRQL
jgi:hypothetical protein